MEKVSCAVLISQVYFFAPCFVIILFLWVYKHETLVARGKELLGKLEAKSTSCFYQPLVPKSKLLNRHFLSALCYSISKWKRQTNVLNPSSEKYWVPFYFRCYNRNFLFTSVHFLSAQSDKKDGKIRQVKDSDLWAKYKYLKNETFANHDMWFKCEETHFYCSMQISILISRQYTCLVK